MAYVKYRGLFFRMKRLFLTLVLFLSIGLSRKTVVKLATLAPEGTEWHGMLMEMGQEWKKKSKKSVHLRVYPGGVIGDERDMVRKMRIGQIHAAAITTEGLSEIVPDFSAYYVPLAFQNSEDVLSVTEALLPSLEKQLDKQGAIEENMLFLNRNLSLEIDDILAQQNGGYSGGTSFGVFNNSEDMALNLGFTGYRRGSYDFYKTDWKYLNDFSTRGGFDEIEGALVPAGTSTVYDQVLGQNIKRPFLHIRYRASETENRKMKSWVTGSVGGPSSSPIDEMRMHYLSERCLIVQGANNFVLFKNA